MVTHFPISRTICLLMVGLALTLGEGTAAEPQWESLLASVDPVRDAVVGQWTKSDNTLTVAAAQGARLSLLAAPDGEYDLRCSFTRKTGQHSIGLIVVHGGRQVVFEVDAWGSHLAGFQNIGGKSIRDNPTRCENIRLENNKRYMITVEVRKDSLRGLLDGREIAKYQTDGHDVSLSDLWAMPNPKHLGLVAWECDTTFHSIELRKLNEVPATTTASTTPEKTMGKPSANPTPTSTASSKNSSKSPLKTAAKSPRKPSVTTGANPTRPVGPGNGPAGQRVLIIIASHHFFYREYGDPRQELERAGIKVTVAAGRKAPSHPHPGSGQGPDGGVVMPDLALSAVKAADYDAVLFSGGWGSSMYQYAFNGRYDEPAYNGDRATKTEANRIINEFLAQDKYVCALCNGVTALAWARVDGKSPLAGKRVCAPTRQAAPGIYNGRRAQPSCRWHPEANGAILSPAGSIGQPGTAADDVLVDGKIITGEDDISAREMGRRIVGVLSKGV